MLKECLWHRQGPTQPEEPRGRSTGTRTTRMPAQAEFHAQTQVTYDHFWDRQQESWEEALRVARDAHHWMLAMVAMLERHRAAELLHLSWVAWQLGAIRQSRSGGCSRHRRHRRIHGGTPLPGGPPWGCYQEVAAFNQPCVTQKVGHF